MENDDNRVDILGYSKSRLEVFLNGVVFLLFHSFYEAFYVGMKLPINWSNKDFIEAERPILSSIMFLTICYILINISIFGGRIDKMQEKYGTLGIVFRKIIMFLVISFLASFIPMILIISFF